jgi:hypothetical protein
MKQLEARRSFEIDVELFGPNRRAEKNHEAEKRKERSQWQGTTASA